MPSTGSLNIHDIFEDKHRELFGKKRGRWSNQFEFILSCLGFTIGLSTFLKFPILMAQNGGAAFLIPYVVMLLLVGLPLVFLNMSLGQYHSLPPNNLLQKLSAKASGIGWVMVIICFAVSVYHAVVISWSMYYTYASFSTTVPYGHCGHDFSTPACYTNEHLASCRQSDMYYYNGTCQYIQHYCAFGSNFSAYNETHCVSNTDDEDIRSAELLDPRSAVARRIYATEDFQRQGMLGFAEGGWSDIGGIQWHLVLCLVITWVCVFLGLFMGTKSISKVMYLTVIFPYIALICLFIRAISLPGAYDGLMYFISHADLDKLTGIKAWFDAATHVFQTYGMSLGGFIVLASYNKFNNNCMVSAFIVTFITTITSLLFGIVLFSIMGFLAYKLDLQVWQLVEPDSISLFVVSPGSLALMPSANNWAILFYIMVICIAINTQLVYVETVSATIRETFRLSPSRFPVAVCLTCFVGLICGLPMCLRGGQLILEVVSNYSGGMAVVVCLLYLFVTQFIYGFHKVMKNIYNMEIELPGLYYYWGFTWSIITPAVLIFIITIKFMYGTRDQLTFRVWPPSDKPLYGVILGLVLLPVILKGVIDHRRQNRDGGSRSKKSVLSGRRNSELPSHEKSTDGDGRYVYDNEAFTSSIEQGYDGMMLELISSDIIKKRKMNASLSIGLMA